MAAADPRARHPPGRLTLIPPRHLPGWLQAWFVRRHAARQKPTDLLRWNLKVLGSELARQAMAEGRAGPGVPLPEQPVPLGLTSRVCRQADIESDWLRHWCGVSGSVPIYHRKLWEDCFVLQALWEAGVLRDGASALGFAVGREALPALLAGRGLAVTATDLDPRDSRARAWIATDQHGAEAAREALFRPHLVAAADFAARVSYRHCDMRRIPPALHGRFDAVWSVCALEHLGTLERGLDFVVQAMRCLKPGGVAVHTTEYNLDPHGETLRRGTTVLYQQRHLEALAARLAAEGHEMLPLDLPAPGTLGLMDRFLDLPPYPADGHALGAAGDTPHLRLSFAHFPVTSAGLIIRARG